MRLKRTFVLVVGSLLTLGAYADYYEPVISPDPAVDSGPTAKKLVIRHDSAREKLPPLPPGFKPVKPNDPPATSVSSINGSGRVMQGDGVIMATATPQQTL